MYATETTQYFCHVTSVVLTVCILSQHRHSLNVYTVEQKTRKVVNLCGLELATSSNTQGLHIMATLLK